MFSDVSRCQGTLGVTEVDADVSCCRELLVGDHLRASVPGKGGHHGPRQASYLLTKSPNHTFGVLAINAHQHHEPAAALDQGSDVGVARASQETPSE
jgi:hypothetical protein